MKVLVIGATGNLGLRLIPALLTHTHTVVAFVRSPPKLESLLPRQISSQITIVQGDATDAQAIKSALLDHKCDAVVNTAGLAALAPWGKSELPTIVRAVVDAVREVAVQRRNENEKPLRLWVLGGLGVLLVPGVERMCSDYIPIYREHRQNLRLLKSLPTDIKVDWSMLCPSTMTPESSEFKVPTQSTRGRLIASATTPPAWHDSWIRHIPFLGPMVVCAMNAPRYETTLEQNADFIAADLETYGRESQWSGESRGVWSGCAVGVIDASKAN